MKRGLCGLLAATLLAAPAGAFAQSGKPVIAIYEIDDVAGSGLAPALSAMIETAVANTSKFRVIERERLGKLLGEQARAKAGLITSDNPGRMGGFEGADFLIYGTITTVSVVNQENVGSNLMLGLLGGSNSSNPNCNNTVATLGLDIKITDADTGEVRYVARLNEAQKSATQCGGGAGRIDAAALMRTAADKVASGLVTAIYPIQVAAVQADGSMLLNYGEGAIQPEAIMGVYAKGQVIRDPATGEILANDEVQLGYIRVTSVNGRVSKAVPLSEFAAAPEVGAIVRAATPAEVKALRKSRKTR